MAEKVFTREGKMSREALRAGVVTMPEGVTYLAVPGIGAVGEFPHVAMDGEDCPAALLIHIIGGSNGGHDYDPWCTRAAGHEAPHVAHIRPGQPVAAWTDAEEI